MISATPAEAIMLIERYNRRIEHLEEVEIPAAHESARQSGTCGRYRRATDYIRLAWECRIEADALRRAVDQLEARFPREELCHSPEAP